MTRAQSTLLKELFNGLSLVVIAVAMALAGCDEQEKREKVFDLETPGVDIEIEKSTDEEHGSTKIETDSPADN